MGLSPELQGYAENIWRRFPEEFISLGAPHLEEDFELHQSGSWRHRVVDTKSEKVIEIVLPRREKPLVYQIEEGEDWGDMSDEEFNVEEDELFCKNGLLYDLDRLGCAVNQLSESLVESVSREVRVQMNKELRHEYLRNGLQSQPVDHGTPETIPRLWDSEVPPRLWEAEVFSSPHEIGDSPSSSVTSSLAARRGWNLTAVQTRHLRKNSSPESVKRMPHLDRLHARGETSFSPARTGSAPRTPRESQQSYSSLPEASLDESPGALIARRAACRR